LIATAYHEAGHAVAYFLSGRKFRAVTIQPNDDYLGCVEGFDANGFGPDTSSTSRKRSLIERNINCSLAGPIAEAQHTRTRNHVGASSDYHGACELASYICGSNEEIAAYLKWLEVRKG
jgi:ATP-dependent Zn protease